ncbi:unnamed protein product [Zymoseptoria tritici ST99CH_3D7]|uniref:Uncharacterized protein n=1 Tax=Zymoseptoria tritici (strain ST99CH_3D7) TaxID=1276538 RepID=A0A1X7SAD5_ZYMT9|nr:unnamed protein product [Zymoseptoria tritici ST99CH_3D7]
MQSIGLVQRFCLARMPPPAACPAAPPTHENLLALVISLLVLALLTLAIGLTDAVIRPTIVVRLRILSTLVQSRLHAAFDFVFRLIASAKLSFCAGLITCKAAALRARSSVATTWPHLVAFISYIVASTTTFFSTVHVTGKTAILRAHNKLSPIWTPCITCIVHIAAPIWTHCITYIKHISADAITICNVGVVALKAAALRTCHTAATTCTYLINYATAAISSPANATRTCCSMTFASDRKLLHHITVAHLKELTDRAATETGDDSQEHGKDDAYTGRKSESGDDWVELNM